MLNCTEMFSPAPSSSRGPEHGYYSASWRVSADVIRMSLSEVGNRIVSPIVRNTWPLGVQVIEKYIKK
jgi:hypothetical protein